MVEFLDEKPARPAPFLLAELAELVALVALIALSRKRTRSFCHFATLRAHEVGKNVWQN